MSLYLVPSNVALFYYFWEDKVDNLRVHQRYHAKVFPAFEKKLCSIMEDMPPIFDVSSQILLKLQTKTKGPFCIFSVSVYFRY